MFWCQRVFLGIVATWFSIWSGFVLADTAATNGFDRQTVMSQTLTNSPDFIVTWHYFETPLWGGCQAAAEVLAIRCETEHASSDLQPQSHYFFVLNAEQLAAFLDAMSAREQADARYHLFSPSRMLLPEGVPGGMVLGSAPTHVPDDARHWFTVPQLFTLTIMSQPDERMTLGLKTTADARVVQGVLHFEEGTGAAAELALPVIQQGEAILVGGYGVQIDSQGNRRFTDSAAADAASLPGGHQAERYVLLVPVLAGDSQDSLK
ncbi:hypothetical protein CUZ56_01146 [Saezia sanguinis]|uniref:Uncharacterized protein n=1 Tax=Saezia sanguinis TaxID=1965230 RepID=A0A433SEY6_9BURK|nr:hypothetical protein [Saezia sanguinis]RUS67204.1 hypothetical protein CUZ56_01146 [Saezia sanguinis]